MIFGTGKRKISFISLLFTLLLLSYLFVFQPPEGSINKNTGEKYHSVLVTKVIDGDTIQIETGKKVRYIGIDAPELHDPRTDGECFAKEAQEENKELVEGKKVRLEKDVSETDRFGRLLRYVYLDPSTGFHSDDTSSERAGQVVFINDYLVRNGHAFASSYPPDIKYQDDLREAQRYAQTNSKGLWRECFDY